MTVRFMSGASSRSELTLPGFTDPPRVTVVTYAPSPYQVELFNEVSTQLGGRLSAVYLYQRDIDRHWSPSPVKHASISLDDCTARFHSASEMVRGADLLVANFYRHTLAAKLIESRVQTGKPWCFWGERPGYTRWAHLGHWYRRVTLAALHRSRAAIWGIGDWAVDRYRAEFGAGRAYFNVPYFSDLRRFTIAVAKRATPDAPRRFLFSGSLIPRKGVDLVATAFLRLATEFPQITLTILGTGELERTLKQQLASYSERVRFVGFQPWETLPQFYADADVVVVPSRHDGWALVVPEGLASNAPVIGSTRMGAALELIHAGENGWLVKPGNLDSLLAALRQAAALPAAELVRMSAAARASVEGHMLTDGARRFTEAVRGSIESFYD
jgi:glycosyltransferase involved in cell wall biosynthesis